MDIVIHPYGGWTDLRAWLLVETIFVAGILWIMWGKAWRREPPGFIWRTFMDDRGVPDAKIVAACHAVVIMSITMMVGWVTGNWPPVYVWVTWDFLAVACILGSTYVTKRYYDAGGSTAPHPDFGLSDGTCAPGTTGTKTEADTSETDTSTHGAGGPDSM